MLKHWNRAAKVTIGLGLMMGIAVAAKNVQTTSIPVVLPNILVNGNVDTSNGTSATAKAKYNTKTKRLVATAHGNVTNASKKRQKFDNVGVIGTYISSGQVTRDRYTVTKKGRATYSGLVKNAVVVVPAT